MSDATLPPLRSSSSVSASEERERSNSSQGEGDFDTSGEHHTSSGSGSGTSGESEGKVENKQRRKRTSPKDQAILETEYKKNPKPNKAARAEIVEKVSLSEKEVQIWFQNRRQINRRKSRPLLPHEIAAFGLRGMNTLSSDPAPIIFLDTNQVILGERRSSQQEPISREIESSQNEKPEHNEEEYDDAEKNTSKETIVDDKRESLSKLDLAGDVQSSTEVSTAETSSLSAPDSHTISFTSTPGYLANRWNSMNSSFSTPSSSQAPAFATPPILQATQPSSCPERIGSSQTYNPSSQMRLSLSLDGKAELISTEPSPLRVIPPRPSSSGAFIPLKRARTLQRSQSAFTFGPLSRTSPTASFTPRLPTGRSRDARTWEFCCDADAEIDTRDELTAQAENESNGSAVAAISLLRSTSNSALKSNSNKRNASTLKQDPSKLGKRAKLGRATSSLARLQNPGKTFHEPSKKKDGLMRSPTGDSDKENWAPHENGIHTRRRPLPSSRAEKSISSRAVLGDNFNVPSHAVDFGGRGIRRKKQDKDIGASIFEDQENKSAGEVEVGGEVEKFMRGEISPSKKGDLDCVQGLLSLSQGNWR